MTYHSYVRSIISGVEKPPTTEWEENPPDHGYIERHLLYFCVMWLNATPNPNDILDKFSPREIILRHRLNFNKQCRGNFGEYILAHEDPDFTNDTKERTYYALYLRHTGNFKAFDFKKGRIKKNRNFTCIPIPD